MKKYIVLFSFLLSALIGNSQTSMRDLVLGRYTGTYDSYTDGIPPLASGVKITAYPTNADAIYVHDTINNIIDSFYVDIFISNDTFFYNFSQCSCGLMHRAIDSISISRVPLVCGNPQAGKFKLKAVSYDFPLAIKEEHFSMVNLYPNPVEDKLIVEYEANKIDFYNIISITGQSVKCGVIENLNKSEIDISALPPATYCIKLHGIKGEIIKIFVKN